MENAKADPAALISIGTIAAQNIARALDFPPEHAKKIEEAIKDEINLMSSHFTLAFADIQTQYEIQLAEIKSTFKYARENIVGVSLAALGFVFLGVLLEYGIHAGHCG